MSISGLLLAAGLMISSKVSLDNFAKEDDPVTPAPKTAFDSLSFDQKINLLIAVKVNEVTQLTDLEQNQNIFLSPEITREKNFEQIRAFSGLKVIDMHSIDHQLPANLQLGAANEKEAVGVKYDDLAMRIRMVGANVVLSNEFNQLIFNGEFNTDAYTQSPYFNQQFWKTSKDALGQHGIVLGGKGFFEGLENNRQSLAILQTFHFAGLRELARSEQSVLQVEDAFCKKLDSVPAAFSTRILEEVVRENQGFKGVVLGPDFSSKSTVEQVNGSLRTIRAGVDLVIVDKSAFVQTREKLANHFKKRKKRLDEKARRIFSLRRALNIQKPESMELLDVEQFQYQCDVASLTVLKNDGDVWPIKALNHSFVVASNSIDFESQVLQYVDFDRWQEGQPIDANSVVLVLAKGQNLSDVIESLKNQQAKQALLVIDYADLYRYRNTDLAVFDGIIVGVKYSNSLMRIAVQAAFGAVNLQGKLPFYLNPSFPTFSGNSIQNIQRLAYTAPEALGLNPKYLKSIDSIAQAAIAAGAFPGCQIQMTWKGHVVYQSAHGHISHKKNRQTDLSIIYDLASITKIAGSTVALMSLEDQGKLTLTNRVKDVWSGVPAGHPMANIVLKDMMAHQAGLPAWIPFYTKTVVNNRPMDEFYSMKPTSSKSTHVAKNLYILDSYSDTIYDRIFSHRLREKKYKYSDLGYYFVKKIVEQQTNLPMEEFLANKFYEPMGLRTVRYRPLEKFPLERIAPTEHDRLFRQQLVHGYVHDPGAAMMGGVGGHAGIFSNANDLSVLMQMLLNEGVYGGKRYLSKAIIDQYTAVQFPGKNRRGAGFDKPKENTGGGTCADEASPSSYGHSGFTGTLTWVDPKYDLNYVFLSNRVNPDAENWKIVKMNVRTDIQSQMIQAIQNARVKSYFSSWDLVNTKSIEKL